MSDYFVCVLAQNFASRTTTLLHFELRWCKYVLKLKISTTAVTRTVNTDLNSIEYTRDVVRHRIEHLQRSPLSFGELKSAVVEESDFLPQILINTITLIMDHRCKDCLGLGEDHRP